MKKGHSPFVFIVILLCFWALFLKAHLGYGAEVRCVECEAHGAAMNTVLGSSIALTVFLAGGISVFLGLVLISVRRTMSLCELETAVAALEEMAFRWDIHLARLHQREHLTLLFLGILFCFRAGIVGAAFTAAMRGLASFAHILLSHIVLALKCKEAKRAVQANLANHGGVIHGLWQLLVWQFLFSIFYRKKGCFPFFLFIFNFLLFLWMRARMYLYVFSDPDWRTRVSRHFRRGRAHPSRRGRPSWSPWVCGI